MAKNPYRTKPKQRFANTESFERSSKCWERNYFLSIFTYGLIQTNPIDRISWFSVELVSKASFAKQKSGSSDTQRFNFLQLKRGIKMQQQRLMNWSHFRGIVQSQPRLRHVKNLTKQSSTNQFKFDQTCRYSNPRLWRAVQMSRQDNSRPCAPEIFRQFMIQSGRINCFIMQILPIRERKRKGVRVM